MNELLNGGDVLTHYTAKLETGVDISDANIELQYIRSPTWFTYRILKREQSGSPGTLVHNTRNYYKFIIQHPICL